MACVSKVCGLLVGIEPVVLLLVLAASLSSTTAAKPSAIASIFLNMLHNHDSAVALR